jgi:hypothetical protein
VPVACPIGRSETVCSGHSRTTQIVSELQILWSARRDKPVPKLIVRGWRSADQAWTSGPRGLRSSQAARQSANCPRSRERGAPLAHQCPGRIAPCDHARCKRSANTIAPSGGCFSSPWRTPVDNDQPVHGVPAEAMRVWLWLRDEEARARWVSPSRDHRRDPVAAPPHPKAHHGTIGNI